MFGKGWAKFRQRPRRPCQGAIPAARTDGRIRDKPTVSTVEPEAPRIFRFADLELDEGRQRVLRDGSEVSLPKLSFDLLLALLDAAPNFVSLRQLMDRVWPGLVIGDKTVTQRVKLLRDALEDDNEEPRYVAGLRGRGYRIVAPVIRVSPPPDAQTRFMTARRYSPRLARMGLPIRRLLVASALPALVLVAWWLWSTSPSRVRVESQEDGPASTQQATEFVVAVLPFRDLSGKDPAIAQGMSEAVLDALSKMPGLSLIARNSSFRAAEQERSVKEISDILGARYLVDGSVQRGGETLRVSAQLVDAVAGTQVWAQSFDRSIADIFGIQDEIAASVAGALGARASEDDSLRAVRPTANLDAYFAYLRGRMLLGRWTLVDADAAVREFESATHLDPAFAAAYASLYDARLTAADRRCGHANPAAIQRDDTNCRVSTVRKEQQALIDKALELDPHSGAAYFARAIWAEDGSTTRDADFRQGLQLDPSNGRGITAYAEFLDRSGRREEAARMLERAIRKDPLSPRAYFWRVMRNWESDVKTHESGMLGVLEVDPDYVPALQRYAKYRWILHGELAQGIRMIEHALALDPDNPWLRHTAIAMYLDIGDVDAARDLQSGDQRPQVTGRILLSLYDGDVHNAADAALSGLGLANGKYENWGVYDALREYTVASGEYARSMAWLDKHTGLGIPDARIARGNFRAVPAFAQMQMLAGHTAEARKLLLDCIQWIDDVHLPRLGGVFALRVKAESLLMLGDTQRALDALEASFVALDYVQWWYTIDHDPLWAPLHDDPRFAAIATRVRQHVHEQQQLLEKLRAQGSVPRRDANHVTAVETTL